MLLFIVTYSYPIIHRCIITCHVISPQLTVQCHTQKKTAPCGMNRGSAVADLDIVLCMTYNSNSVYRYQFREDQWNVLPSCPCVNSGLVIIDGVLTAVGGWDGSCRTNKLFTLRQSRWVEEYFPSATICENQLYVIGYYDDGYSCSLQPLLSSDQPISSQSITRLLTWTPLPRLAVTGITAATLCGQLVIIGGERDGSLVNSIHQLVDGQWVNIGSMSSGRRWCLVASPSPDTMVVVGGWGAMGHSVEVCVAE